MTAPVTQDKRRERVIEGLVAAVCDPECPTQFTPLLMEARKMLASVSALQRGENPRVTDNDQGEITVDLNGKELRGWSYENDDQRRQKMLQAREYIEGWCDGRGE